MRLSDDTKQLITEAEIRAQDAKFRDTTNSTAVTNGAVVIDGGLGLAKDLVIGGNIIGDGATNISGITSVTASFADNEGFFGNGAGLINTGATLSEPTSGRQRIVLTDKTGTAQMTTAATEAGLGGNTFDYNFATHTLRSTNFEGALSGNATSSSTSANLSFGSANQVVFKNGSNNGATSSALTFLSLIHI